MDRLKVYLLEPQDSPFYYIQWLDPATGKRVTRSLKTASQPEAERKRADKEYELNNGLNQERSRMAWASFLASYEQEKLTALPRESRKNSLRALHRFGKVLGEKPLGAINERLVSAFRTQLEARGFVSTTVATQLGHLQAALRWAVRQKLLSTLPLFELPKLPKKRIKRTLDQAGYERLLQAMPSPEWRLLVQVAWYTGMRRGELLALHWDEQSAKPWVEMKSPGRIWLPAEACNGGEDSWLPIHEQLLLTLQASKQERGLVFPTMPPASHVSEKFGEMARGAGLKITLHDLRRSFGTRYARVVPAQVLQRLMRHKSIQTTLGFYVDQDKGLDEAIMRA